MMDENSRKRTLELIRPLTQKYRFSSIEGILCKNAVGKWLIFYSRIMFANTAFENEFVKPADQKAICFRLNGNAEMSVNFILQASEKENYFISHSNPTTNKIDISSQLNFESDYQFNYTEATKTRARNPFYAIYLGTTPPTNAYESTNNLNRYPNPSLITMAKNELGIDLFRANGWQNKLIIGFEREEGKITGVNLSGAGLSIYLDYDENRKDQYELLLFRHPDNIETKLPVKKQVDYPYQKEAGFTLLLLLNGNRIDEYRNYTEIEIPRGLVQQQVTEQEETYIIPKKIANYCPPKIQTILLNASITYKWEIYDCAAFLLRKALEHSIKIEAEKIGKTSEIKGKGDNFLHLTDMLEKCPKIFPKIEGRTIRQMTVLKIYGDIAAHDSDVDILKEDVDQAGAYARVIFEKLFKKDTL